MVYKNQPPGAAAPVPSPPAAGTGIGTGSALGPVLQPWQQLLQQRPVLTMMEQNIAAIASGVGGLAACCGLGHTVVMWLCALCCADGGRLGSLCALHRCPPMPT